MSEFIYIHKNRIEIDIKLNMKKVAPSNERWHIIHQLFLYPIVAILQLLLLLILKGGILEGQDFEGTPTVEIFDPLDGIWVQGPALNVNRFRLRLFVINNILHAVGGDRDPRGSHVLSMMLNSILVIYAHFLTRL